MRTLCLILLMLSLGFVHAGVVYDTSSSVGGTIPAGTSCISLSHPTTSNPNRLMLIGLSDITYYLDGYPVTATYDGVSATQLGYKTNGVDDWVFNLTAPDSGTYNVQVCIQNPPTCVDDGDCDYFYTAVLGVSTFSNVSQSTSVGTPCMNASATSPIRCYVTGNSTDNMLWNSVNGRKGTSSMSLTVGVGQAQRWNLDSGASGTNRITGAGSTKDSSVGSVQMNWTESVNKAWAAIAVEIFYKEATGGGGTVRKNMSIIPILSIDEEAKPKAFNWWPYILGSATLVGVIAIGKNV